MTPRIPPKNGAVFAPGQVIRVEFPAQGYVNPLNTTLEFDVTLFGFGNAAPEILRFQNGINSIFNRVRLLYGSTPLEDIINYNVIVRALTDWTGTSCNGVMDQTSIAEGWGGYTWGADNAGNVGMVNSRQKYIQGISQNTTPGTAGSFTGGAPFGGVPVGITGGSAPAPAGVMGNASSFYVTRRYQVNFALGLFTQDKLFMASQLAVELTLETAAASIFVVAVGTGQGADPTYAVSNVNLIPEILEFDASYDEMFLRGLRDGGVPIKFSSWHTFTFSSGNSSSINLLVQERSRSVKALFAVQRRQTPNIFGDHAALFFDTAVDGLSALQNYQFRIGGRYFPAAPVQTSTSPGSAITNGGAEAFIELQKALNVVGDYRLSTTVNAQNWALQNAGGVLQEFDYRYNLLSVNNVGVPSVGIVESGTNTFSGSMASACFAMATDLETSNGIEISGLNAEELSDISLIANWKGAQVTGASSVPSAIEVYSYYDAMLLLRENNVIELVQ